MKGGCVVALGIAFAALVGGVIVATIANLSWIEERFGYGGFSFAVGAIFVMVIVFSVIALVGAIMFGVSGLWMQANKNAGVMVGTMSESIASIIRYSRLPAGQPQAKAAQEPVFPQYPRIEYGARPGQGALAADDWPSKPPPGLAPPEEGEWARLERRSSGRHGEVVAK